MSHSLLQRPFEFVLMDAPYLNTSPEPEIFGAYFENTEQDTLILSIPNLTKTAKLVVPRQIKSADAYTHIAAFMRKAPRAQVHKLWQVVGEEVYMQLSEQPLWLSTAGDGVAWLHVRIENTPKYYTYYPYTRVY